jgi:hypothetical protein
MYATINILAIAEEEKREEIGSLSLLVGVEALFGVAS